MTDSSLPPRRDDLMFWEALAPIERTIFFGTPQRVAFHIVSADEEDRILEYRDTYLADVSQARRDLGEGRARLAFALVSRNGEPIGQPLTSSSSLEEIDERVRLLRLPLNLLDMLSNEYVNACDMPEAEARRMAALPDFENGPAESGAPSVRPASSQDAPSVPGNGPS